MFSYDDYKEIIRIIKSTKRQANYKDALYRDNFIIMRHDVESVSYTHLTLPTILLA